MSELSVGQLKGLAVNNNVVMVPSGHKLYSPGHILQVVTSSATGTISTTSTSFVSASLSASITPTYNTSKIFVVVSQNNEINAGNTACFVTVYRGDIATGVNLGHASNGISGVYTFTGVAGFNIAATLHTIDSPNTSSSVTYTVAFRVSGGTGILGYGNQPRTITLMEIAQ